MSTVFHLLEHFSYLNTPWSQHVWIFDLDLLLITCNCIVEAKCVGMIYSIVKR